MNNELSRIEFSKEVNKSDIDVFIFSTSYEARCMQIAKVLNIQNIKEVYLCRNEPTYQLPEQQASHQMVEQYTLDAKEKFGDTVNELFLSKTEPIKTIDAFIEPLAKCGKRKFHVLVDITCFTHESLLILQKVIHHFKVKATYAYSSAEEYNTRTKKDEDKWLSRGIGEVRSVLGYPGVRDPLKDSHLIVLVGFEFERARKLIDRYEPTHLSLGYAEDEIAQSAGKRNEGRFNDLKSLYPNAKEFSFSTHNVQITKGAIIRQIEKLDETNPIVAPMNTKISTHALAMAAEENERIQICYASALVYNVDDYSEPSGKYYLWTSPSP